MEAVIDDNFQEVRGHIEQFRQILKGNAALKDGNNNISPTRYSNTNQEAPQSRTTTEITLSTSSEVTQFDDSEINSKIISFPQSPIESKSTTTTVSNYPPTNEKMKEKNLVSNKNSFSSSFDTDLASSSPKYNFKNNQDSDEENEASESDFGTDSDSDPELSSYIAQHSAKVNYLLSKVGFPTDSKKQDQQLTNSESSDSSDSDSETIDPPPELLDSLIGNIKPITIKNVEMSQSIQDTLANYNNRNSKRQQQIEKAMKLLLSVSNDDMSSEYDSNSESEDDNKIQNKAQPVSLQISQPVVLLQKGHNENEEEDTDDSSNIQQKSLFQLDEISSDSDDVPLFIPPVPDEIEMDTNFNLLLNGSKKKVDFDKGITSPEALDASGKKLKRKKNDKYTNNKFDDESSDSMNDTVDDESTLSFNKIFESITKKNSV